MTTLALNPADTANGPLGIQPLEDSQKVTVKKTDVEKLTLQAKESEKTGEVDKVDVKHVDRDLLRVVQENDEERLVVVEKNLDKVRLTVKGDIEEFTERSQNLEESARERVEAITQQFDQSVDEAIAKEAQAEEPSVEKVINSFSITFQRAIQDLGDIAEGEEAFANFDLPQDGSGGVLGALPPEEQVEGAVQYFNLNRETVVINTPDGPVTQVRTRIETFVLTPEDQAQKAEDAEDPAQNIYYYRQDQTKVLSRDNGEYLESVTTDTIKFEGTIGSTAGKSNGAGDADSGLQLPFSELTGTLGNVLSEDQKLQNFEVLKTSKEELLFRSEDGQARVVSESSIRYERTLKEISEEETESPKPKPALTVASDTEEVEANSQALTAENVIVNPPSTSTSTDPEDLLALSDSLVGENPPTVAGGAVAEEAAQPIQGSDLNLNFKIETKSRTRLTANEDRTSLTAREELKVESGDEDDLLTARRELKLKIAGENRLRLTLATQFYRESLQPAEVGNPATEKPEPEAGDTDGAPELVKDYNLFADAKNGSIPLDTFIDRLQNKVALQLNQLSQGIKADLNPPSEGLSLYNRRSLVRADRFNGPRNHLNYKV